MPRVRRMPPLGSGRRAGRFWPSGSRTWSTRSTGSKPRSSSNHHWSAEGGIRMSRSAAKFSRDEGYYASMADLMAGMLFIFIIVAMVFAIDVRQDRVEAVAEAAAKAEARVKAEAEAKAELKSPATPLDRPTPVDMYIEVRARLVEAIRDYLAARGVQVESEPREGLLRLPADRLFAPSGATPLHDGQVAFSHLADALDTYLPCLAKGASLPDSAVCKPFTEARLR